MLNDVATTPAVKAENISFRYDGIKALNELTLEIPSGISFGLLGPNGAGKTTLIRLLVGLLQAQSGNLEILGKKPTRKNVHLIGYMPQQYSLYNELSVEQNIDFFARIYHLNNKSERNERVEEVIKLVDLWPRRKDQITRLSGGMKQRVSLACAIVHKPLLLFLDEPTVGLDPKLRVNFWEHFKELTAHGTTIVISSHTMDDAAHCDLLAFIRNGKVIANGTPDDLRQAVNRPGASLEDAFLYFIDSEGDNGS